MKIKLHYYYSPHTEEIDVSLHERSKEYFGEYPLIQVLDVEVPDCEMPSNDVLRGKVADSLREEKARLLAECHQATKAIDEKIQQLLCLDNKGVTA